MSHVYCDKMPITSNYSTIQMNSNNLRGHSNTRTDVLECMLTVIIFIAMAIVTITITVLEKVDKRPVLPFTTHDVCSSTGVSLSPTYANTLRRVSSSNRIIEPI